MSAIVEDPGLVRRTLTRAQYDVLVDQGAFEGQRIELLEGELVEVAPQGPMHSNAVNDLAYHLHDLLVARHGRVYWVRQEKPFAASAASEPEPDISVIERRTRPDADHPSTAPLLIEMAWSSRRLDLDHKPRIYAAAGVPLYWVVDLARRRTVVHRDPVAEPEARYDTVTTHPFTDDLEVLGVTVRVADALG